MKIHSTTLVELDEAIFINAEKICSLGIWKRHKEILQEHFIKRFLCLIFQEYILNFGLSHDFMIGFNLTQIYTLVSFNLFNMFMQERRANIKRFLLVVILEFLIRMYWPQACKKSNTNIGTSCKSLQVEEKKQASISSFKCVMM